MLRPYINTPNVWPFVDKVYWKHSAGGNVSIAKWTTINTDGNSRDLWQYDNTKKLSADGFIIWMPKWFKAAMNVLCNDSTAII